MSRVFVSPIGYLRERWQQAFADASVVSTVAEVKLPHGEALASLWLDMSVISQELRLESIAAACALGSPVIVMAGVPEEAEALSALRAGVRGYCHVTAAPEQLRDVALVVENGGLWMPPSLMQRFLVVSTRTTPAAVPLALQLNDLTVQELTVADKVGHGLSNREIAETLEISERTVKAHLTVIFEKMGVRDRVQLALKVNNIEIYSTLN